MTVTVEPTTPSAVIDRVSLVLEAFDGPGRLTLAQIVRRTGLPRSSAHRMLERLVAALAAPQRPRLRARHAPRRAGFAGGAPGPAASRRDPLLHELHRATGLVVHLAVLGWLVFFAWRSPADRCGLS